jgi:hypothetical protein
LCWKRILIKCTFLARDLIANDGVANSKSLKDRILGVITDDGPEDDDSNYGTHLPGAGEGSEDEDNVDESMQSTFRAKRTKVNTFFGIPKVGHVRLIFVVIRITRQSVALYVPQIDGRGLRSLIENNPRIQILDLAHIPDIDDRAIVALVDAVLSAWMTRVTRSNNAVREKIFPCIRASV